MMSSILDKAKERILARDYATALAILKPLKTDKSLENENSTLQYLFELWAILSNVCIKKAISAVQLKADINTQQGEIFSICYNPINNSIVSCSKDGSINIFSLSNNKLLSDIKTDHEPILCSILVKNEELITGHTDSLIKHWDLSSRKLLKIYKNHSKDVKSLSSRFDGKYFVSGGLDRKVNVWNAVSGEIISSLENNKGLVLCVDFSLDGKFIVAGCSDSKAICIDVKNSKIFAEIDFHENSIRACAISPNCKILALGSDDKTISLWNLEDFTNIGVLKGHNWDISSLSFSPDGRFLASGSRDRSILIWNIENLEDVKKLDGHTGNITSLKFIKGGRYLLSASEDRTIKIWELDYILDYNEEYEQIKDWKNYIKIYVENYLKQSSYLVEQEYNRFVKKEKDVAILEEDVENLYKELCERGFGFVDKNEIKTYLQNYLDQFDLGVSRNIFSWLFGR